jgi:hypothetical protein
MKIINRKWDFFTSPPPHRVLFKVKDGQEEFVCSIAETELAPNTPSPLMDKKTAEALFDEKKVDIEAAAREAIIRAEERGTDYKRGEPSEPIPVSLPNLGS